MKLSKIAALSAALVIAPLSAQAKDAPLEFAVIGKSCKGINFARNSNSIVLPKDCDLTTGDMQDVFNRETGVVQLQGSCNGITFKPISHDIYRIGLNAGCAPLSVQ